MKNNYRKLKFSILLQTVLVTALTVLVGGFILRYIIDGPYNDKFSKFFIKYLKDLNIDESTAIHLYWKLIGDNKTFSWLSVSCFYLRSFSILRSQR